MRLMCSTSLTAKVPAPMAMIELAPAACNTRIHMRMVIDSEAPPTAEPMMKI